MRIINIIIFFFTTFVGYYIGKWIAISIGWAMPKIFIIDPNFLQVLFSRKPTMTSELLGYIIYAITALIMFILSSYLQSLYRKDWKIIIKTAAITEQD